MFRGAIGRRITSWAVATPVKENAMCACDHGDPRLCRLSDGRHLCQCSCHRQWLDIVLPVAAQQLAKADAGGTDKDAMIALGVLATFVRRGGLSPEAVNRELQLRGSRHCVFNHAGVWDVGELPASSASAA
jgi:hypothetical protein